MANWEIHGPYSGGAYRVSTGNPEDGGVLVDPCPRAKEMAEIICCALLASVGTPDSEHASSYAQSSCE